MTINLTQDMIKNMNQSELRVANFINKNCDKIFEMNIDEVAESCYVSKTTIVRTAKKMGFNGFTELKYAYRIEEDDSIEIAYDSEVMRNNDISNTNNLIKDIDFESLINLMKDKRICFFGKGLNEQVCDYAVTQLLLLGFHAIHLSGTHIAMENSKYMTENDLLFIVSNSGETDQCIRLALQGKKNNVKVISLTSATRNTLSKLTDLPYYVFTSKDNRVPFDNASRVPMLMFFHKLFDKVIEK